MNNTKDFWTEDKESLVFKDIVREHISVNKNEVLKTCKECFESNLKYVLNACPWSLYTEAKYIEANLANALAHSKGDLWLSSKIRLEVIDQFFFNRLYKELNLDNYESLEKPT